MSMIVGIHSDPVLTEIIKNIALEDFKGPGHPEYASKDKYIWLREMGSNLWLDTGDADAAETVWSSELEALTTNNTLVNQVAQTGELDGLISYAMRKIKDQLPSISIHDLVVEIAFLVNARLALSLVEKFGAHVSVELHPDLGNDVEGILTFARRYYDINPDFFYIKVPITPDGFIAVRQLSREGIPINYTLGFSARQNYLATKFSMPRFVNVFLGRLNSLIEENGLGSPNNIGERAALASDEMVKNIRASSTIFNTRQIAASMRSGDQVVTLAGMDVLTIPPKVAQEYLDMDITRDNIQQINWRDLAIDLDRSRTVETSEIMSLWEISPQFIGFVKDAEKNADQMKIGQDLVDLSRKHGINLFYDWSDDDLAQIREKGKIPDMSQWPGAPLDDLMSMSALQTFAKDQQSVDQRIEQQIKDSI